MLRNRGKLIAVLIVAVHAVGNRHKVNMMLTEEYLRVKACLQIITPRPAHIFYNDMSNFARFDVCNKLFPSGRSKFLHSNRHRYSADSSYNLSDGHSFGYFF